MAEEDLSLARDFAAKLQKVAEGVPLARVSALPPSVLHHGQPEPGVLPPPSPLTHTGARRVPLSFSSLRRRILGISARPYPTHETP